MIWDALLPGAARKNTCTTIVSMRKVCKVQKWSCFFVLNSQMAKY